MVDVATDHSLSRSSVDRTFFLPQRKAVLSGIRVSLGSGGLESQLPKYPPEREVRPSDQLPHFDRELRILPDAFDLTSIARIGSISPVLSTMVTKS